MRLPVTQKDDYGCSVACVAFHLGISYRKASSLMGRHKAENKGFNGREIESVLKKYGLNYTFNYLKPKLKKKIYKDKVIVFIKRSKNYPSGHYLVRYRGFWMDPWINFKQNKNIRAAKSGYTKRLPERPIYALFPM